MENEQPIKQALPKRLRIYARDYVIAIVACALLAVTLDYICYLALGETTLGTWYDKYWIGFFFCCAFITSSFVILRDKLSDNPEYLYLIIVLVISVFMTWSLSFYIVGWDTGIHFRNVLGWADLDAQFELSRSELAFASTNLLHDDGTDFSMNLEGIYQMVSWLDANNSNVEDIRPAYSFWNILTNINYIPCSFVMYFCELLNAPFSVSYFLSLLPCPLIYSFVTFFGMKKLDSGKMLYGIIALFPTSIFLSANYGYQYWNLAFFLYAFACLAAFLQRRKPVAFMQIASMLLAFVLASLPRLSYAPLILLSLLIPKSCFKTNKVSRLYRAAIILITLLAASIFAIPRIIGGLGAGDTRGGSSIDPNAQLQLILADPVSFLRRVFEFIAPPFKVSDESSFANDVVSGFLTPSGAIRAVGFYGYLGYLPYPLFLLLIALLTTAALTDKNNMAQYGCIPGIASIGVSFGILVCIIAYMYMDFNNVGENAFRGVQSRYLLPFAYPCLAFIGKRKWGLNGSVIPSGVYNGLALGLMAVINLAGWWFVYLANIY